jgi:hypothetical protein
MTTVHGERDEFTGLNGPDDGGAKQYQTDCSHRVVIAVGTPIVLEFRVYGLKDWSQIRNRKKLAHHASARENQLLVVRAALVNEAVPSV